MEKATRRAQSERYQSVDEMLADIKSPSEHKPAVHSGKSESPWYWIAAAAAGLLAGIATTFLM